MALQPTSNSGSQFAQQGSVDWVSLATTSISFPVTILARLAAADISALTVIVTQNIASNFHLSHDGQTRLTDALRSLACYSSLGNAFYFGFGIKHIIRDLGDTREGLASIALCGCLSELLTPKACASILMELTTVCGAPGELCPSPQQWMNFVGACSGVLKSTNFSVIAGQFMSYYGGDWKENSHDEYKNVAQALHAVSRLSSGSLESITLVGGRSCGWIAAFGYRFLGIDVEISTAKDGVLFTSADREDNIRIRVIYGDQDQASSEVQVSHATYFIPTITNLFTPRENQYGTVMSGTVLWKDCLRTVFGAVATRLLSNECNLGRIIGLSARVFEGLSMAESSKIFDFEKRRMWFAYQHGQRGRGFILSAAAWFPEIGELQEEAAEEAAAASSLTLDQAAVEYDNQMFHLQTLCHPGHCPCSGSHCLATLAETIIFLIWNLAGLKLSIELSPYRFGLQFIYELVGGANSSIMVTVRRMQKTDIYGRSIQRLMSFLNMASIYHTAQFLFTTDLYEQTTTAFSAACTGGLCFYLGILAGATDTHETGRPGMDSPETATLLHVVPGRIETKEGRTFSHVLDTRPLSTTGLFQLSLVNPLLITSTEYIKTYYAESPRPLATFDGDLAENTGSTDLTASLVVQESPDGLLVEFCFSCARGRCLVGPYMLFREIALSSGLVYCRHQDCPQLDFPPDRTFVVDGEADLRTPPPQDTINVVRVAGNSLARCVGLLANSDALAPIILRGRECIPCCIAAAVSLERSTVFVVL